jgi:hypothetical protein
MNHPPYVPAGSLYHLLGSEIDFLAWGKWFAWHPVKLQSGKRVFMQTVYRRKQTLEFERFPAESIGMFTNKIKLSGMIYSDGTEVMLEKLEGKESFYAFAREIVSSRKEGRYKLV